MKAKRLNWISETTSRLVDLASITSKYNSVAILGHSGAGKDYVSDQLEGGNLDAYGAVRKASLISKAEWLFDTDMFYRDVVLGGKPCPRIYTLICDNMSEALKVLQPDHVIIVVNPNPSRLRSLYRSKASFVGPDHPFYKHWMMKASRSDFETMLHVIAATTSIMNHVSNATGITMYVNEMSHDAERGFHHYVNVPRLKTSIWK